MRTRRYQSSSSIAVAYKGKVFSEVVSGRRVVIEHKGEWRKLASSCNSIGWRFQIISRKKIEADREDMCNLFLPDAHFEVDKPVLFKLIAQAYQIVDQAGNSGSREDIRGLSLGAQSFLSNFFLLLPECLPARIEFFPQSEALRVFGLVVVMQA